MAGAAALAARGALRAGAGLVTVGTAASIEPVVAAKLDCAMTLPLPDVAPGAIASEAVGPALEKAASVDVVGVGPGLGTHLETRNFLAGLLRGLPCPLVLDADGLNLAAQGLLDTLANLQHPKVVTPHPGEMSRLLGSSVREVQADRKAAAVAAALSLKAVVILKGADSVITDGTAVHINPTGNPGMATGGTGDVLTGVIVALLGQGLSPLDAARVGAYVHGRAGDLAAESKGIVAMTASDLAEHLPGAFLELSHRPDPESGP